MRYRLDDRVGDQLMEDGLRSHLSDGPLRPVLVVLQAATLAHLWKRQNTPKTFSRMITPIGTPHSHRMMLFMRVPL